MTAPETGPGPRICRTRAEIEEAARQDGDRLDGEPASELASRLAAILTTGTQTARRGAA